MLWHYLGLNMCLCCFVSQTCMSCLLYIYHRGMYIPWALHIHMLHICVQWVTILLEVSCFSCDVKQRARKQLWCRQKEATGTALTPSKRGYGHSCDTVKKRVRAQLWHRQKEGTGTAVTPSKRGHGQHIPLTVQVSCYVLSFLYYHTNDLIVINNKKWIWINYAFLKTKIKNV